MTYILETLEFLQRAIVADDQREIARLLDLPIADIARVSDDATNLRAFLIGNASDAHGIVIDDWNRSAYKTVNEAFCRIYEVFEISDELPIYGKSLADLEHTYVEEEVCIVEDPQI